MSVLDTRTPVRDDPAPSAPDPSTPTGWFTALLRRFHFYAGLLVGPFVLVAAVTGGLYAFAPQLDESVHATALHVTASPTALSLADQVAAATRYAGGLAPVAIRPAPSSTDTTGSSSPRRRSTNPSVARSSSIPVRERSPET